MLIAALALTLSLGLLPRALPSHPAIHSANILPAANLAPERANLAGILSGGFGDSRQWRDRAVVSPTDLGDALGARQRRFGLFRVESAVDGRREVLRRLPFGAILAAAGERNRIDPLLLAAVAETESRFAPHAVSPCGAVGLMQLLPSTGHDYGVNDLRDPYANVDAGSRYLRALLDRFSGRSDLALAAYNTGPEVIARYGCVPPYRETQDFVKRVLTRYDQHREAVAMVATRRATPIRIAAARPSTRREPAAYRPDGEAR